MSEKPSPLRIVPSPETMLLKISNFVKSKGFDFNPKLDGKYHEHKSSSGKIWQRGKIISGFIIYSFGNWKTGEKFAFKDDTSGYSKKELADLKAQIEAEKFQEEKDRRDLQESISTRTRDKIQQLKESCALPEPFPYYAKKKIKPVKGVKIYRNSVGEEFLCVPMADRCGVVWGAQFISDTGEKHYTDGQKTDGCFFHFGELNPKFPLYLCEGLATAASLHEALTIGKIQGCVVTCFSAHNLKVVAVELRQEYPEAKIVIAGDNDLWGSVNRGQQAAFQAAHASKACVLLPPILEGMRKLPPPPAGPNPPCDKPTDWNDLHCIFGLKHISAFLKHHKPLSPAELTNTEYNGFHSEVFHNGKVTCSPEYLDLANVLNRDQGYKTQNQSEQVYMWTGVKYEDVPAPQLKGTAQERMEINFEQVCDNHMAREFYGVLTRTRLTPLSWFTSSTAGFINMGNGVFHRASGELVLHSAERGFRTVLDYDYDPKALCPEFDKMMAGITQGDKDLELLLLEYMGYCLSGDDMWTAEALVCLGGGANGKSTFFKVLRALIGEENVSNVNVAQFLNDQQLYLLDGKLCNISEESSEKALFKTAEQFKNISDGGEITAKKLYSQPYQFKNRAKLVLSYNTFPRSQDTSHGLVRRLLFAKFDAEFSLEAKNLDRGIGKRVVSGELSGVFNKAWAAYVGCLDRGGFTVPESTKELVREFRDTNDTVHRFFGEHCAVVGKEWSGYNGTEPPKWARVDEVGGRPFVVVGELYAEYKEWCERNGFGCFNSAVFGRKIFGQLKNLSVQNRSLPSRKTVGGATVRVIKELIWCSESEI